MIPEYIESTGAAGDLAGTRLRFVGSAYNAERADNILGPLQGRNTITDVDVLNSMVVQQQTHEIDFVGRILGRNPSTGGSIPEGSSFLQETLNIFDGAHTVHSCYGLGADKCFTRWNYKYPEYVPVRTYTKEGE